MRNILQKCLCLLNKNWTDIKTISSDSASYMKAMVRNIRAECGVPDLVHCTDIAHLIHVAVNTTLNCGDELASIAKKFVIKIGALFRHSPKLFRVYEEACVAVDLSVIRPSKIILIRWFSFYEGVQKVIRMWQAIKVFLDKAKRNQGAINNKKLNDILFVYSLTDSVNIYAYLLYIEERLKPIQQLQRQLETNKPFTHQMHSLINEQIEAEVRKSWKPIVGGSCDTLLQSLNRDQMQIVSTTMKIFSDELKQKWHQTINTNVSAELKKLWKMSKVFDPYKKQLIRIFDEEGELKSDFAHLCKQFINPDELQKLKNQLNEYLLESPPENENINILQYWIDSKNQRDVLSKLAINCICLPIGSCEVERAFSALRQIQTPERNQLSESSLKAYLMLYFNNKNKQC